MISLGIALVVLGAAAGIWLAMRIVELPSADRAKGVLQRAGILVPALAVAYLLIVGAAPRLVPWFACAFPGNPATRTRTTFERTDRVSLPNMGIGAAVAARVSAETERRQLGSGAKARGAFESWGGRCRAS